VGYVAWLHGVMNEAELHVLQQRMYQGKLNTARRGELFGPAPIGDVRLVGGEWAMDPDEQVQAVVRLIFDPFDREATVHGLLRYLVHHGIAIPVRPNGGPNKGQREWHRPSRVTLQNLLHHPSYAGAYRYGHRPTDPRQKRPGRPNTGKLIRRPEECLVLLRDHLPADLTWERFEANQPRLTANRNLPNAPGAPRDGPALLAGLVRCGSCGRRMRVRYAGPKCRVSYACLRGFADHGEPLCQILSDGRALEEWVAAQLRAAVRPAALEASLAAVAGVEQRRAELQRQWQWRRERAAIASDRAARQYHACEPENRLVARELERRWEEALKQQRQLDEEDERFARSAPPELSEEGGSSIRALASDLPAVWSAATTSPADRQRVARLLLERVVVTVEKAGERVEVELHWVGGAVQPHGLRRAVARYDPQSDYPRRVARLRAFANGKDHPAAIAERLNTEGFRPPKRVTRFTTEMVRRLMVQLGLARPAPHGSPTGLGPDEDRPTGLAQLLGISRDPIRNWRRVGWLNVRRDEQGHCIIWADAAERRRLRELHELPRTWANRKRLAELKKPKPRPAR
jgi:hypothetical protein